MLATHHLDLNHPDFIANPYPTLQKLRDDLPVFYDEPWDKVFFTRYEDIAALLRDKRLELQTLFKILLQRLPKLRLVSDRVEFGKGFVIRGLRSLPVALG